MIFRVCEKDEQILYRRSIVRLQRENRNDAGYITCFDMTHYDALGREQHCGLVKIGKKGMRPGDIVKHLPKEFEELPEDFFSLGQDEDYYEQLKQLGPDIRQSLLLALRDMAYLPEIIDSHKSRIAKTVSDQASGKTSHNVIVNSLLKEIASNAETAINKVKGQLHRMAHGGARLTKFEFDYEAPKPENPDDDPTRLTFSVVPESNPPTNVHAMIGRNGSGKTYLIQNMVRCLQDSRGPYGRFTFHSTAEETHKFANVICIAFSPFDNFSEPVKKKSDLPAIFVGLNKESGNLLTDIGEQFWTHLKNCMASAQRQQLWTDAISILEIGFNEYERGIFDEISGVIKKLNGQYNEEEIQRNQSQIMSRFTKLSSGHKVVLLTITSCVAEIEEKSILFLDEPENHLHPPLLSALIRALSDLLIKRNGMAIVSTHSPVVLQEIPCTCVWKLDRRRDPMRPRQETFGTTIGALTNEVFRLESENSGFHKILKDHVRNRGSMAHYSQEESFSSDYKKILQDFNNQLGDEARMLLWSLLVAAGER